MPCMIHGVSLNLPLHQLSHNVELVYYALTIVIVIKEGKRDWIMKLFDTTRWVLYLNPQATTYV